MEIQTLEKVFEIHGVDSWDEPRLFWDISSLCCDDDNNIYVADSGWNQIFKFDSSGRHVGSYGRPGQGPGEFMANAKSDKLMISYGNNNKFYVYDQGNNRISVFSESFEYERSFSVSAQGVRIIDTPLVNSRGEILLLRPYDGFLIQRFDGELNHMGGIFPAARHFHSDLFDISATASRHLASQFDLRKALTKEDGLVVLSNHALRAFIYSRDLVLIGEFSLAENRDFFQDFKKRAKEAKRRKMGILPFTLHLDDQGYLCLGYYKSTLTNFVFYRYNQKGRLIDMLEVSENILSPFVSDRAGCFYARTKDQLSIGKFRIKTRRSP